MSGSMLFARIRLTHTVHVEQHVSRPVSSTACLGSSGLFSPMPLAVIIPRKAVERSRLSWPDGDGCLMNRMWLVVLYSPIHPK